MRDLAFPGFVLGLICLVACAPSPSEMTIIVISMDTTRPDHLTPYDASRGTTPNLDQLSRDGVLFTQARTTAPWTLPAHMSLFTGQPPAVHEVVIDFQRLDPSRPTMGEVLSDAGFTTAGFFTAPYVHGQYGFDRGFDFYERLSAPTIFDLPLDRRQDQSGAREALSHRELTSHKVFRQAKQQLRRSSRPRNLLFLHLFDPHYDFIAPPANTKRFTDTNYRGPVDGTNPTGRPDIYWPGMPSEDRAHFEGLYDAELNFLDQQLGLLLEEIRSQGREDTTLIAITSDHGEEFFERGRFGHRSTLYDEVLRVPLILWGPGFLPGGLVIDEEVSVCDILPTLMDYAGIPPDSRMYGVSLRSLVEQDTAHIDRPDISALTFIPRVPNGFYVLHESAVHQGLKIIRKTHIPWSPEREQDLSGNAIDGTETIEIFDLTVDPHEKDNLWPGTEGDDRIQRALAMFNASRDMQKETLATYHDLGVDTFDIGLDEIRRETGYLGGTPTPSDVGAYLKVPEDESQP